MEKFIELILKEVKEILGANYNVSFIDVDRRNNITIPSLAITDNRKYTNTTPAIQLEKYYEMYVNGESLYHIASRIIDCYRNIESKEFNYEAFFDFDIVKHFICYELINTEENKELLKKIPNRPFLDLSICYYVYVNHFINEDNLATITVTNEHLEKLWNVTEEDLYKLATVNTPTILGESLDSMRMVLKAEGLFPLPCMENDLYILSNRYYIRGASVVLYTELLRKFASLFEENLWLLPSSTNEWLVILDNEDMEYEDFIDLITSINKEDLPAEQVLSNHPYYFNKSTMQITLTKED